MAQTAATTSSEYSRDPLEHLDNLKLYKYSSVDESWISENILTPYWNWAVELLPMWMAPNLVTLVGFFPILASVGLLQLLIPDLVGPGPWWFYLLSACVIWFYSTMDNIDGKQARRTRSSSPLGELFDHGLDSVNCTLAALLHIAAMQLGSTKVGAFTAIIPCLTMYLSTWETYHTHTLYLGPINGPTEGLIIAVLMMTMSAIFGPQIWSYPLQKAFPAVFFFLGPELSVRDLWVVIMGGAFLFAHVPFCLKNGMSARNENADKVLMPIWKEWTPIFIFTAACCAWLGSPYSYILRDNHLILFCVMLSPIFGRMTNKIILAHLTRTLFPASTVMLVPLCLGAILVSLPYVGLPAVSAELEHGYLALATIGCTVYYLYRAFEVIGAICERLNIRCLQIEVRPEPRYVV